MNPSLALLEAPSRAHPLFPIDQAILWLPGIPGFGEPYCSYNVGQPSSGEPRTDFPDESPGNTVPFAPRHPVSLETFVSWDLSVSPPLPFHPLPISRPLDAGEMKCLAMKVAALTGEDPYPPAAALHNGHKAQIYTALSEIGVPASFIPQVI